MKTFLIDGCAPGSKYQLVDPDAPSEAEFEHAVVRGLTCAYPTYECIVFSGGFRYDDRVYKPDLALVARDRSHWFVIEVELTSHSLEAHVLPQVRAFQYGSWESDCIGILARELALSASQAETMLTYLPRSVIVIANRRDDQWRWALSALEVQVLTVSRYRSPTGVEAIELDGNLEVVAKSVGFGTYSATDRSLVVPKSADIRLGRLQIDDPTGAPSAWTATVSGEKIWITKDLGAPDIDHGSFVQLIRTVDGRLSLRRQR